MPKEVSKSIFIKGYELFFKPPILKDNIYRSGLNERETETLGSCIKLCEDVHQKLNTKENNITL